MDTRNLVGFGVDHVKLGHVGEVITIDPDSGDYLPEPVWHCYTCNKAAML